MARGEWGGALSGAIALRARLVNVAALSRPRIEARRTEKHGGIAKRKGDGLQIRYSPVRSRVPPPSKSAKLRGFRQKPAFNFQPAQAVVLQIDDLGQRILESMCWSLVPARAKDKVSLVLPNAS